MVPTKHRTQKPVYHEGHEVPRRKLCPVRGLPCVASSVLWSMLFFTQELTSRLAPTTSSCDRLPGNPQIYFYFTHLRVREFQDLRRSGRWASLFSRSSG